MYPVYQSSKPPRIPSSLSTATLSTGVLQEDKMLMFKAGNKLIGTAVLGSFVSPDSSVAGTVKVYNSLVSAGDYVFVTLDTPSATTLGDSYCVPSATVLAGSFVIKAVSTASGAIVTTDTSTIKYMVVKPVT